MGYTAQNQEKSQKNVTAVTLIPRSIKVLSKVEGDWGSAVVSDSYSRSGRSPPDDLFGS